MCTCNGGPFLQEQLDSIFAQTFTNMELLVVDDASTDETMEVLRRNLYRWPAFNIVENKPRLGYNKNFEKALGLAGGEFIAIADQDDIWEPGKIELLVKKLSADKGAMLAHGHSAVFETGRPAHTRSVGAKRILQGNDVRKLFLFNQISGHNMVIRKSLLLAALPFPDTIYYDWWLAVAACCKGTITGVDEILVYHRRHIANATTLQHKALFYQSVLQRLPILLTVPHLTDRDRQFGKTLLQKFSVLAHRKRSAAVFWYLLRHASIIFSFKKKIFPYFSYVKHAARLASSATQSP